MLNCQFRITTRGDIIRTTWALRSEAITSWYSCQGPSWDESTCPIYSSRSTLMVRDFSESFSVSTDSVKEKKWSLVVLIRFYFESKFSIQITSTAGCPMVTCLVSIFRKSIFFFFWIFDFCSLLVTASDQDQFDKINFQLSNKVIHIKIRHS